MQKIEKKLNITHPLPPPPKKKLVLNNGFLVGEVCKLYSWLKVMGMIKKNPLPKILRTAKGNGCNVKTTLGEKIK